MNLAIFDLDGTLAKTFAVDENCFIRALETALEIGQVNTDWSKYTHVSDSGVIQELFEDRVGRHPRPDEILRFVECFLEELAQAHATEKAPFAEVPGAAFFLNQLRQSYDWCAAIATGSWESSAKFKLSRAGLPAEGIPAAFAEDGPSREGIVRAALKRALAHYDRSQFDRVVLVGDGIWDLRTARRLELPFVGVAEGVAGDKLRAAGSSHVLENFLDHQHCLKCFADARAPQ